MGFRKTGKSVTLGVVAAAPSQDKTKLPPQSQPKPIKQSTSVQK